MTEGVRALGPDELAAQLARGQGEQLAFLPANPSAARLAETFVACANAHGGTVVIGVTGGGKPQGIDLATDAAMRELVQAAGLMANPPLILPPPRIVSLDGKRIAVVQVPPGDAPRL
jgi:predicted HTH transcriptional regulator